MACIPLNQPLTTWDDPTSTGRSYKAPPKNGAPAMLLRKSGAVQIDKRRRCGGVTLCLFGVKFIGLDAKQEDASM